MIHPDQFCEELGHLRRVAQNWVREYLNDAEEAAYRGEFYLSAKHCENAIEAAKASVNELDSFLERHLGHVMTPEQAAQELYDGNDNFLRRVENAVCAISLLAIQLQVTSKLKAES